MAEVLGHAVAVVLIIGMVAAFIDFFMGL